MTGGLFGRSEGAASLAERALDAAAAITGTAHAALYVRELDRITLFASLSIDQRALAVAARTWELRRGQLEAGKLVTEGDKLFVPVAENERLLGILFLGAPTGGLQPQQQAALEQIARVAAVALSLPIEGTGQLSTVDVYLERATGEDIARRRLLVLCERHEWNIARVARALGVTRATVYRSLERFGLERRKVRITKIPAVTAEVPGCG